MSRYASNDASNEFHSYIRFNQNFEPVSSEFGFNRDSSSSDLQDYGVALFMLPALIFCLFFGVWMIFCCGLLFRCCCFKAQGGQSERRKQIVLGGLVLCLVGIGSSLLASFGGFVPFTNGLLSVTDSANRIADIWGDLQNFGVQIEEILDQLEVTLTIAADDCVQLDLTEALSYTSIVTDGVAEFNDVVGTVNIQGNVDSFNKSFEDIVLKVLGYSYWPITILLLLAVGLFGGSLFLKNVTMLKVSTSCSCLCLFPLLLLALIVLMLGLILGDFCQDPDGYILDLVGAQDVEIVEYYVSCVGENPVTDPLTDAVNAVDDLEDYLTQLLEPCSGTAVDEAVVLTQSLKDQVGEIETFADCEFLNPVYTLMVHDGFCTDCTEGLYVLWGSQIAVCTMLIIGGIFASMVWWQWSGARHSSHSQSYSYGESSGPGGTLYSKEYIMMDDNGGTSGRIN